MKIAAIITLMILTAMTRADFTQLQTSTPPQYHPSLIRVIANPNEFDGKRIRVIGFLGYNGLDKSIGVYISEIDGRNFVIPNSVSIRQPLSQQDHFMNNYIIFNCVYHSDAPEWGNNGYLDQVTDIQLWNSQQR